MQIIGAGTAGLLAAHYFRDLNPTVWERQPKLPNNHTALLRLRSDAVGRITGVPLRCVPVNKAIMEPNGRLITMPTLLHANAYARKVTGVVSPRSIIDLAPVQRWVPVAPATFNADLASGLKIEYGCDMLADPNYFRYEEMISTVPMSAWATHEQMNALLCSIAFRSRPITTINVRLLDKIDIHQTIYYPWLEPFPDQALHTIDIYRFSFTGGMLTIEMIGEHDLHFVEQHAIIAECCRSVLGFAPEHDGPKMQIQKLGKIVPLEQDLRRTIIMALSDKLKVFSLGRFATWRQLLLDDLVHDLEVIRNLVQSGAYERRLQYSKRLG